MQNPKKRRPPKIPVYIDCLPPCNNACPAGENIQAWLDCLKKGEPHNAWSIIMETNPLPAIHGRVCYHPCESACNRKQYDETINIHGIERYLGDMALENGWSTPIRTLNNPKRILIVGSGPAGLSAAYHLRHFGHEVTIYEAKSYLGGMMRSGIPAYRLPRNILDGEIERIRSMGVTMELNHPFTEYEEGMFDAIFLALGAEKERNVEFKKSNPIPVLGAIEFLKSVELKKIPKIGDRLAIYGGGNTAIDVARTARRLGVPNVTVVYRRDRKQMPAFDFEVEEALNEKVEFKLLRTIKEIQGDRIILETMELGADNKLKDTERHEDIHADMLILALGQDPDTEYLKKISDLTFANDGSLIIDTNMSTPHRGIFAGGDVVTHDRSVTIAVGHGRKAAFHIDAYLRTHLKTGTQTKPPKHDLANYDILNFEYTTKAKTIHEESLSVNNRENFDEVVQGINKEQAFSESERCLSCGNCFECDGCYEVCPVNAISKLGVGKRYYIDLETCIGCSKCFHRCPCGAIIMVDNK